MFLTFSFVKKCSSFLVLTIFVSTQELKEMAAPYVLRRTKELLKATGSLKVNKFEYIIWLKLSYAQVIQHLFNNFTFSLL